MLKLGSHVGMSGKEMLLGSAKEAVSTAQIPLCFIPALHKTQKEKRFSELNIEPAWSYMKEHNINENRCACSVYYQSCKYSQAETFELAVDFLRLELERASACKSNTLILHPGAHVGAGTDVGIEQIAKGINEVLTKDTTCNIALETMAGKGTEIGRTFEELAQIYDKVVYNDKLRVCFDTCHTNDSGYDIVNDFDGVIEKFDKLIGKDQIAVFHINDSKNVLGAKKDRHANLGFGEIGFDAISYIVHHKDFEEIPKILETPYIPSPTKAKKSYAPYRYEIEMLRANAFQTNIMDTILQDNE